MNQIGFTLGFAGIFLLILIPLFILRGYRDKTHKKAGEPAEDVKGKIKVCLILGIPLIIIGIIVSFIQI